MQSQVDLLMLIGDMSYADLNTPNFENGYSKQLAWDCFFRMLHILMPSTALLHVCNCACMRACVHGSSSSACCST